MTCKTVVISDEDNYRMELMDMRWGIRNAIRKAPYYLSKDITWNGKSIYTDLRTLWGLTQDSELCDLRPIKRLKRDLQWRFSSLLGDPDGGWSAVGLFHLRDYYLFTQPSSAAMMQTARDLNGVFHSTCVTAAAEASSQKMCELNLAEHCQSVSAAMMELVHGTRKVEDVRNSLGVELAMLECALGIAKESLDLTDKVEDQLSVLLPTMGVELQSRNIEDYFKAKAEREAFNA